MNIKRYNKETEKNKTRFVDPNPKGNEKLTESGSYVRTRICIRNQVMVKVPKDVCLSVRKFQVVNNKSEQFNIGKIRFAKINGNSISFI